MRLEVAELKFKLESHRENLCYELWKLMPEREIKSGKNVGKLAPAGWVSTGKYPTDQAVGLRMMLDMATNVSPETLSSVSDAASRMEACTASILSAKWVVGEGCSGKCACSKPN